MRRCFSIFLLALAVGLPATSVAGTLTASLSSKQIYVGEAATLEVSVSGSFRGQPTFADVAVVSVRLAGQHSQTSMRRGRTTQSHTFTYRVSGLVAGKATLGPAKLEVDGRELRSEYFQIEILARRQQQSSTRSAPARAGSGRASRTSPGSQSSGIEDYYATATLSTKEPWVGQSLLYQVEVGSTVPPRDIEWEPPSFSPLSPEPNLKLQQEDEQKIVDGQRYTVNNIAVPLFPIEAGPAKLDAAAFAMTLVRTRGLFGTSEQIPFRSNEVTLDVRPLPTVGRPSNFTGAVGNYTIKASVDRPTLDAGETATLTVEIRGAGALRGEKLSFPLPEGIRSYEEQPDVRSDLREGAVRSLAIYSTTLVPLQPDSYSLPPVSFSFFEPKAGSYRTVLSEPIQLEVGGSPVTDPAVIARSASLGRAKEEVEILGVDILPLHRGNEVETNTHLNPGANWFLSLIGLPFLGLLGLFGATQRERFAGTAAGKEKVRRADAKGASKSARSAAKEGNLEGTEQALRSYLVARLGTLGGAVGPEDAKEALEGVGAPPKVASRLKLLLGRLEAVRYGGASEAGLVEDLADWVEQSEKEWR
jgi:hypothetical protein